MSTKEIITIAGGIGGIQLSSAMWELFCEEYGIDANGRQEIPIPNLPMQSFFEVTEEKITPRTVMIYPRNDISHVEQHDLTWEKNSSRFHRDSKIEVKNNYNEKFFKEGYYLDHNGLETTLERIRVMCERCSNLDGFLICRDYSEFINGFISKLLERLSETYKKKTKIDYAKVLSVSPLNHGTRMPVINTLFTVSDCIKHMDCCIITDDCAVINTYKKKLQQDIARNYTNFIYNRMLAQAFSGITSPLRFSQNSNWGLDNYKVLVPYKEIPFVTMSYAPLAPSADMSQVNQTSTIRTITRECLEQDNQLFSYKPREGAYISSLLVYRGSQVIQTDIVDTLANINKQCKEGRDIRGGNCIGNPFQAESVRTEATALQGGYIGRPRILVASCSNNTKLYHYWKELAVYVKEIFKDETRYFDKQLTTLGYLQSSYEYINTITNNTHNCNEDLKNVNECLLNMLERYAELDYKIEYDKCTEKGFM